MHIKGRRGLATGIVVAAAVGCICSLSASLSAQAPRKGSGTQEITGPVRVIDGDTLEVYINGRQTAIGLMGIDAPEANTSCGRKAAEFLQDMVNTERGNPAKLKLRFEEDLDRTFDVRTRRMYYLKLPGAKSAALALVSEGLADPDGTGEELEELLRAARRATKCVG